MDFRGPKTYILAVGSRFQRETFLIRRLQVADRIIKDVIGSVGDPMGDLLLGQSFLSKFNSVSMDGTHVWIVATYSLMMVAT